MTKFWALSIWGRLPYNVGLSWPSPIAHTSAQSGDHGWQVTGEMWVPTASLSVHWGHSCRTHGIQEIHWPAVYRFMIFHVRSCVLFQQQVWRCENRINKHTQLVSMSKHFLASLSLRIAEYWCLLNARHHGGLYVKPEANRILDPCIYENIGW